jgi:transcriptional regulator CtsR
LYQQNVTQDKNINLHRHVLDEVENCLGTILNNLGIHPVIDDNVTVNREFNMLKSIMSNENKVYKVFSLEAIESILETKKKGVIN